MKLSGTKHTIASYDADDFLLPRSDVRFLRSVAKHSTAVRIHSTQAVVHSTKASLLKRKAQTAIQSQRSENERLMKIAKCFEEDVSANEEFLRLFDCKCEQTGCNCVSRKAELKIKLKEIKEELNTLLSNHP